MASVTDSSMTRPAEVVSLDVHDHDGEPLPIAEADHIHALELQGQFNVEVSHLDQGGDLSMQDLQDVLEEDEVLHDDIDREIKHLESRLEQYNSRIMGEEHLDFMRPKNYFPYFCCAVLVVCSGTMVVEMWFNDWKFESFAENPTFGPSSNVLIQLGAKRTDLIVEKGQWYRLFTPMILHAGLIHLLFNMLGLWNIGFPAEREFGSLKIGIIFFASGVFGVLLSSIFIPQQVGVGASGAIFGLFGAAWADLIQNWNLYRDKAWHVFFQLLFSTVLNLALGLMPFLDNFAHLGGFLCGFICGLPLLVQTRFTRHGDRKGRKMYQLCLQSVAAIALPVMFVVMLLVLYLNVEATEWCEWCGYISCVPMPPGVPDEQLWWDCNPCSTGGITAQVLNETGYFEMNCPDGSSIIPNFPDPNLNEAAVLQYCKQLC